MKTLELRVVETKNKSSKFIYQIIENETIIAERKSNREYVACYIDKYTSGTANYGKIIITEESPRYETPYFFGRTDLIGKGDSGKRNPESFYALALRK